MHVSNGGGVGDANSEITPDPNPNGIRVRERKVTPFCQSCSFGTQEREDVAWRQETSHPTYSLCGFCAAAGGPWTSVSPSTKWA